MRIKIYTTVPTFNKKIVEICKFDIPNTHINDPSWLSSGTSIKIKHFSYLIKTIESENRTIFARQSVNRRR